MLTGRIKQIAIVAILLAILLFWIRVQNRIHSETIARQNAEIEALKSDLDDARSEIEILKQIPVKHDESTEILIKRMDQEVNNYVEKVKEIESDHDACDWLDQPLPDVLRNQFRAACYQRDGTAPTDPIESMLKTTARIHDD